MRNRFPSYVSVLLFLLVFVLNACKPRDVLSRDEMSDVLYDLHLTDAALKSRGDSVSVEWTKGMDNKAFKDLAYQSVLRKHQLTQEDFDRSIAWYSHHTNQYVMVYTKVEKRLQAFLTEVSRGSVEYDQRLLGLGLKPEYVRGLYEFASFDRDTLINKGMMTRPVAVQMNRWTRQWFREYSRKLGNSPLLNNEIKVTEVPVDSVLQPNTRPDVDSVVMKGNVPLSNEDLIRARQMHHAVPLSNLSPEERARRTMIENARKKADQNHWKN